jgi:hypothetical protein
MVFSCCRLDASKLERNVLLAEDAGVVKTIAIEAPRVRSVLALELLS